MQSKKKEVKKVQRYEGKEREGKEKEAEEVKGQGRTKKEEQLNGGVSGRDGNFYRHTVKFKKKGTHG